MTDVTLDVWRTPKRDTGPKGHVSADLNAALKGRSSTGLSLRKKREEWGGFSSVRDVTLEVWKNPERDTGPKGHLSANLNAALKGRSGTGLPLRKKREESGSPLGWLV